MATPRKATAKKTALRTPSAKKATVVRGAAKAATKTATKTAAKNAVSKKAAAKKAVSKKAAPGRRYAPAASEQVATELHEMHEGKLTIGKSKKKVTNPKQAIAIGLAEARRAGADVPPNPHTGK